MLVHQKKIKVEVVDEIHLQVYQPNLYTNLQLLLYIFFLYHSILFFD